MKKYDAILYVTSQINEDTRYNATKSPNSSDTTPTGWSDDPLMYANNNFGAALRNYVNNFGSGYWGEVTDFGKWVVCTTYYHSYVSGKTASKTFLIVFQDKNNGIVLNTSNRWRTISGVDQAASYIRSASSVLQSEANRKI